MWSANSDIKTNKLEISPLIYQLTLIAISRGVKNVFYKKTIPTPIFLPGVQPKRCDLHFISARGTNIKFQSSSDRYSSRPRLNIINYIVILPGPNTEFEQRRYSNEQSLAVLGNNRALAQFHK